MQIGILGLALIFFMSGAKNLSDSGFRFVRSKDNNKSLAGASKKTADAVKSAGKENEKQIFSRRKFGFGLLLMLMGFLVFIYYIVTVL